MYNGIGLSTARGSGTNGYIQRNMAYVAVSGKRIKYRTEEDLERTEKRLKREPNPELLLHERKRKIELKCLEVSELMEDQGFPQEEIDAKVNLYRQLLTKQMERNPKEFALEFDSHGKPKNLSGHHKAEVINAKNNRLRKAFSIDKSYVPGSVFKNIKPPPPDAVAASIE